MLGEEVIMASRIGDDTLGMQVIKRATQKNLNTDLFQIDKVYQTGIVDVSLDSSGNASYEIVEPVAWDFIELDDKYNLRVMDNGQFYGVERFSGGEKDLANLCLRLAISLSLTEAAGLNRSFIILDEIFGSQDNERKNLILSGLANLKERFPQILLITHIDDIKDGVEQIIDVKPTGLGYSEIVIDEGL
jgi:hypothetical protein